MHKCADAKEVLKVELRDPRANSDTDCDALDYQYAECHG
jgi:hypothetical protein